MTQPTVDQAQAEAFMGKVVADLAGTMATIMCALGDHFGLFRDLATQGQTTSA